MFDISRLLSHLSWGHSVNSPVLSTKDEQVPSLPHSLWRSDEIGYLKWREHRPAPHSAENPGSKQSKHGYLPACVSMPPGAQRVLVMERGSGEPCVHTLCAHQMKAGMRDSHVIPTLSPSKSPVVSVLFHLPTTTLNSFWTLRSLVTGHRPLRVSPGAFLSVLGQPVICACELPNSLPTPLVSSSAFSDNGQRFSECWVPELGAVSAIGVTPGPTARVPTLTPFLGTKNGPEMQLWSRILWGKSTGKECVQNKINRASQDIRLCPTLPPWTLVRGLGTWGCSHITGMGTPHIPSGLRAPGRGPGHQHVGVMCECVCV